MKSCGPSFHSEVGKFKFLNEMIKLVSPRYMADQTPEHIKKKVIEMLFDKMLITLSVYMP